MRSGFPAGDLFPWMSQLFAKKMCHESFRNVGSDEQTFRHFVLLQKRSSRSRKAFGSRVSRRAEEFASESSTPQDDTFELNGVFSWDSAGAKLCQSTVKWPRTKKKKQKKYNALAPADDAEASKDDDLDLNPEGGASQAEDPEGGASQAEDPEGCASQAEGFRLRVSNLKIPAGSLVLVIGSVGSGKSSLLGALLSELTVLSGRGVNIKQMVAVSGLQVHQSTLIYTLTNCCLPLSALGS